MTQTQTLSSTDERRVFFGLLIQPPFAAALTFLAFPLIDATGRPLYGGSTPAPADAALSVALGVGLVATLLTVLCVFPTVVWVMKRTTVTLGRAALIGAMFGNIPVVIGSALAGNYGLAGAVRASVFGTLLGVSGATLFWALAIRGRSHTDRTG